MQPMAIHGKSGRRKPFPPASAFPAAICPAGHHSIKRALRDSGVGSHRPKGAYWGSCIVHRREAHLGRYASPLCPFVAPLRGFFLSLRDNSPCVVKSHERIRGEAERRQWQMRRSERPGRKGVEGCRFCDDAQRPSRTALRPPNPQAGDRLRREARLGRYASPFVRVFAAKPPSSGAQRPFRSRLFRRKAAAGFPCHRSERGAPLNISPSKNLRGFGGRSPRRL